MTEKKDRVQRLQEMQTVEADGIFENGVNGRAPELGLEQKQDFLRAPAWEIVPPGATGVFNLQFFAAEDEGRTEDPTEAKKRKSREEGKVPKSQDASAALLMIACFWAISLFGHFILDGFRDAFQFYLGGINTIDVSMGNINNEIMRIISIMFKIFAPVMAVAVVIALFANLVQVGFLFTLKPLKPDFSRISFTPKKIFERVLFSKQSMMNFLKSSVKVGASALIAFLVISGEVRKLLNLINLGVLQGVNEVTLILFKLINAICVALLVFSVVDYIFQRRQHLESIKMAVSEVKEERKQEEGDPHVKQRIMQKSRELSQRNLPENVQSADVVVTNPTHISVVLKYDMNMGNEPVLVAKGSDHLAFVIRQYATDASVPIVENKPVAREIYFNVDIGEPIPEDLFEAVAIIYSKLAKFREAVSA